MTRKIIHVDMDAFYASVEQRDRPELRGLPIAVGGRAESRGVIATASYEARAFGVRSAMATAMAQRLCPKLVLVAPRFDAYREASTQIHGVFARYTEDIEPLSLDEAYLDVSACTAFDGSATRIAAAICQEIRAETGLSASAGVAPNKFLAKVASAHRKPAGLTVVRPQDVDTFVVGLPVGRIPGVGPKGKVRLEAEGIATCGDLQRLDAAELQRLFGSWAERIAGLCRGVDDRPVVREWEPRQVSVERTFASDFRDLDEALPAVEAMWAALRRRVTDRGVEGKIRGAHVKLRLADFTTRSGDRAGAGMPDIDAFVAELARLHGANPQPIRLIGLGVRLEAPATRRRGDARQLELTLG